MGDKPQEISKKLGILKADGSYDNDKIAKLEIDYINFIYDNAVSLRQEVEDRLQSNKASVEWLLRFSSLAVLTLGALLYEYLNSSTNMFDWAIVTISFIILAIYLFVMLSVASILISKSFSEYTYNEPENLLDPDTSKQSIKLIKIEEAINLQSRIVTDIKDQESYAKTLKYYISLVRWNTITAFIVFCGLVVLKLI